MMSSFNPHNRQLTPQEWQEIAHDQVSEINAQYTVIGGVILGLFAAAAASPVTGGLVALFFLNKAWRDTQAVNRNDKAIQGYGCVAHVLPADDLRDFAAQVGPDETVRQIQWAQQHDYQVSSAALDYLESQGIKPRPLLALTQTGEAKTSVTNDDRAAQTRQQESAVKEMVGSAVGAMTRLKAIGVGRRPAINTVDIARAIGENLKPTIITAKPRVGKGIIVSHGWRAAKAMHPNLTVWVIQPKPHPSESGYWQGVDRYWGKMIEDYPVDDDTIAAELSTFIAEWRAQANRPTLLIIDELGKLGAQHPKWYKREIPPLMIVESSSGETDQRYLWGILQSPLVKDVGISSGNRSAFEFMTIEKAGTEDHAIAVQQSIASLKSIPTAEDYDASPVGALCYHSAAGRWMAVPEYDVPAPVESASNSSTMPSNSVEPSNKPFDASNSQSNLLEVPQDREFDEEFDASNSSTELPNWFVEMPLAGKKALMLAIEPDRIANRSRSWIIKNTLGFKSEKYAQGAAIYDELLRLFGGDLGSKP